MELRQILEILWRRKWIVLNLFLAVFITIVLGSLLVQPWYDATAKVLLRKSSAASSLLSSLGLQNTQPSQTLSDTDRADYVELAQVRSMVKKVIDDEHITRERTRAKLMKALPFTKPILKLLGVDVNNTTEIMNAEDLLTFSMTSYIFPRPYVSVDQFESTDIIDIKAYSPDPVQAMRMANVMAEEFIKNEMMRVTDDYKGARTFIEGNLPRVKAEYLQALGNLKQFREREGTVNLDTETAQMIQKTSAIQQGLESKLTDLYLSLAETKTKFTPNHPSVIDIENKIADAKKQLKLEYEKSYAQEAGMMKFPKKMSDFSYLNLAVTVTQDIYNSFLKYKYQVGIAESIALSNIYIIESAITPAKNEAKHRHPSVFFNTIIAILLGTILGISVALLVDYLDDTLKTPADIQAYAPLTFLGSIQKLKKRDRQLVHQMDPRSPFWEYVRTIRNSIRYATLDNPVKSFVVTSALEGEGKSFFASNIATALAKEGQKVLIIDADMRRPSIHANFNIQNNMGLTNYLVGDADLADIQKKTEVTGLTIIPTGPIPPDPARLIESKKLRQLISAMKEIYDIVVVDSPPALDISDAVFLTGYTDGVVVVIESGRVSRVRFAHILDNFKKANKTIIGAVINKTSAHRASYYYYKT
jgi:capsular exopolysaccharide synthesis family protein